MPKFSGSIIGGRPIMGVVIFPFDIDINPNNFAEVAPKYSFRALIDTGATTTSISSEVVDRLNLIPAGSTQMQSATEIVDANVFNVRVGIPINEQSINPQGVPISNLHMRLFELQTIEAINLGRQKIDMLLGMDIISQCILIVDGNQYTFCF